MPIRGFDEYMGVCLHPHPQLYVTPRDKQTTSFLLRPHNERLIIHLIIFHLLHLTMLLSRYYH